MPLVAYQILPSTNLPSPDGHHHNRPMLPNSLQRILHYIIKAQQVASLAKQLNYDQLLVAMKQNLKLMLTSDAAS